MTDLSDLAAKIDAMTLDEIEAIHDSQDDLPMAGGEYDTKSGWIRRLYGCASAGSTYHRFERLLARLTKHGLAESGVPGQHQVGNGSWRRSDLVKSAWMAREAAKAAQSSSSTA